MNVKKTKKGKSAFQRNGPSGWTNNIQFNSEQVGMVYIVYRSS